MMALRWKRVAPGTVPALFLHIQKTAGTSLVHLARQYYGSSLTSHGEYWGKAPEQMSGTSFISGHIGYDFARQLMSERFAFTFLRDPAERILSMYYFCKTRNTGEYEIYGKARELDLPHFLAAGFSDPCIRMHIWNNQVWQLAHGYTHQNSRSIDDFTEEGMLGLAKEHLKEFSFVGFNETYLADVAIVLKALSLPKIREVPRLNATPGRPCVSDQSSAIKVMLDKLTELDRQLYDYAWNEFSGERKASRRGWWRW